MATSSVKEMIKTEWVKCGMSPEYFMKKYCIIQHPMKGKIPFALYDFQSDTINDFMSHRFNIILKARQLGLSTLVAGYALWLMTFHTDKNILVIATKQSKARNLVTKVRIMHANLPPWLKSDCVEDNKLSLRYRNGSQVVAETSSEDAARSEGLSLLILDEAAFIPRVDEIWTAAEPTLSTGGDCIALSTPNGIGNWFHSTWIKAETGENDFNPITLHWSVHPDRDQAWRDGVERRLGDPDMAAQENDCDFISSGKTVVPGAVLEEYRKNHVCEPIEKRGIDQNIWIYKFPENGHSYVTSADVARGDGKDYSAFHIIDIDTMEQVVEYKGKVDTKMYGDLLVNISTEYNDALLIVENNNIGWATLQQVIDRNYKNLFYSTRDFQYVDVKQHLTNKFNAQERKMIPGFTTTSKTRPLIIAKLDEYFRDRSVIIHSKRLINELFVFIYDGNRTGAANGYNDDLVMSLSIGLWVRDTALRLRTEGQDIQKQILGQTLQHSGVYTQDDNRIAEGWGWEVQGQQHDLTWLIG